MACHPAVRRSHGTAPPHAVDAAVVLHGCADDLRAIAQIVDQLIVKLGTALALLEAESKDPEGAQDVLAHRSLSSPANLNVLADSLFRITALLRESEAGEAADHLEVAAWNGTAAIDELRERGQE
jgi:hypothetical protein